MAYDCINSPVNYGGIRLKNRIIFAPTTFGLPKEEYFERMREIAAGGCAMIIVGDVPVKKSPFEKSLFDEEGFIYYQELAEIVHRENCILCAQLHQPDTDPELMASLMPELRAGSISMNEVRNRLNQGVGPYITRLPAEQVRDITSSFGEAAVLAVKAGFDLVQIHGDRMCGSFSSAVYNHRQDEYGGSPVKRARVA